MNTNTAKAQRRRRRKRKTSKKSVRKPSYFDRDSMSLLDLKLHETAQQLADESGLGLGLLVWTTSDKVHEFERSNPGQKVALITHIHTGTRQATFIREWAKTYFGVNAGAMLQMGDEMFAIYAQPTIITDLERSAEYLLWYVTRVSDLKQVTWADLEYVHVHGLVTA